MPCYTVQTSKVEVGKMDRDILAKALEAGKIGVMIHADGALTFNVQGATCVYANGTLTISKRNTVTISDAAITATIKQAYSAGVVRSTAAKMGWKLSQTAPNQFKAQRGWR